MLIIYHHHEEQRCHRQGHSHSYVGHRNVRRAGDRRGGIGDNVTIPLKWTGPAITTSTFSTGGSPPKKGQHHTFKTAAGNFTVAVSGTVTNTQKLLSASSCQFEFATTVPYTVDGAASTGKFAGSTGSGAVTVTFHAYLPKLANGKCNESNNAQPLTKGAIAAAKGTGPLTVKS